MSTMDGATAAGVLRVQVRPRLLDRLNGPWHRTALCLYALFVAAHWAEHVAQAGQIWLLGWPRAEALGVLGLAFPGLVTSEWLHYGYAVGMLLAFWLLLPGFRGRARTWWAVALGVQVWHHLEHLFLLGQAMAGKNLLGEPVPTSVVQLLVPRVELHLIYNAIVTVPMLLALWLYLRDDPRRAR